MQPSTCGQSCGEVEEEEGGVYVSVAKGWGYIVSHWVSVQTAVLDRLLPLPNTERSVRAQQQEEQHLVPACPPFLI